MSDNLVKVKCYEGKGLPTQTLRENAPWLKACSGEQETPTAPERPAERDVFRTLQRKLSGDTVCISIRVEPCLLHP